ncbi:MBL fold metallo-hydrolase [soil metagenome]
MDALRVLLAPNPSPMTLDGTRTFLVGLSRPVVIDPGPADERHLSRIHDALAGSTPVAILLTHAHPDHAAAAAPLAATTGAPVWMTHGAVASGFPPVFADRWIGDGDIMATDAGPVRAVATPGHTPEHLAFLWTGANAPAGGALFVGDLMMGEGDTTLVSPPEGDLGAYLRSLRRVRELKPGVIYPTHGPPLYEAAEATARFLRHREERIAGVLQALRTAGAAEPDALVDAVYGGALHPQLRAAAAGSIAAMLRYLEEEGAVHRRVGKRYEALDHVATDSVQPTRTEE